MEYKGKLYGKVGGMLIPLSNSTDDWDAMVKQISELKAEVEKPKFTLSQVIEMFVVAKSMTEHLDEKGRNEYFDRIINFIGKEETK